MGGLFLKLVDEPVLPHVHDAEARGLLHRHLNDGDGARRARRSVRAQHFGVVHLIHMVAGEDEHVIGVIHLDEVHVLIDRVRGSGKPRAALPRALVRREDVHAAVGRVEIPRLPAADIPVEQERLILREHADGVDTGVRAVGKGEINDSVLAAERHVGFCYLRRQRIQAGALAAGQQHGNTGFFQNEPLLPHNSAL